jgi:hypothetical protein
MKRFGNLAAAVALACFTAACSQTDAGVTSKVKAQLAADETVKAASIDVDTRESVVTLSGEVESETVKEQAVRIARSTEGVSDVVDALRVADRRIEIKIPEDKIEIRTEDDLGDNVKDGANATGGALKDGAEATGNAIEKGAEATADGARKVGGAIRDAVTDDNKDTDKDGR